MAQKRMFNKTITNSDKFLELPLSTQALYFHLNMNADDDGFIDNAKTIKRMIGASDLDLKMLVEQNFLILFNSGIIVVKDWRIHNTIRNDRYNKTVYAEEFKQLQIAESKEYQGFEESGNRLATVWKPSGTQLATQKRIEENRIDKNRLDEDREEKDRVDTPSLVIVNHCQSHGLFVDGPQLQMLMDFHTLDGMNVDVICRAVTEAADNNKRNLKYILAILRNWKAGGILTLAQVEDRERQRVESKAKSFQGGNSPNLKQTNVPEWSTKPPKTGITAEGQAELQKLVAELEELENG
ncbi:DnaD domain protein [Streptococcus marmotae]|uniref:DnaD domain protein n=1 Tax=Streptococcus marmotae TaxID=1825069 RepID=UPI00082DB080|nr:DnaD domain protein [Streptococcus marmotae]QBX16890.1 DNA replication protein [Streptococcus phage Javan291]